MKIKSLVIGQSANIPSPVGLCRVTRTDEFDYVVEINGQPVARLEHDAWDGIFLTFNLFGEMKHIADSYVEAAITVAISQQRGFWNYRKTAEV